MTCWWSAGTREWLFDNRARGQGARPARCGHPGFDLLLERWVLGGRNVGFMTAKTLRLLHLYEVDILRQAAKEALARGTHDPGALAVLCEDLRRAANHPVPMDLYRPVWDALVARGLADELAAFDRDPAPGLLIRDARSLGRRGRLPPDIRACPGQVVADFG